MNDNVEVVIKVKKSELFQLLDKLNVQEYTFKNNRIELNMSDIFKDAISQVEAKADTSSSVF